MKRDETVFLKDILECIEYIEIYMKDADKKELSNNKMLQDAVTRRLEIIGEAAKNIPEGFKKKHPETEWKKIAGLRDVLIHGYFGINIERIWVIVKDDLPKLKAKIECALKELKKQNQNGESK